MDNQENSILSIQLSDDEADVSTKKANRTGQTEDEFQAVQRSYRAKIEDGQIYQRVQTPFRPGMTKIHTQEFIHAVEELYFHHQYRQGAELVDKAFENGGADAVDADTRRLLEGYRQKCQEKL